jgi:TM2 domain-containing membrane protein YozV
MDSSKKFQLKSWLAFIGILDCTCPFEFKGLGRLYNTSMGEGWVRMITVKGCPAHGERH